MKLPDGLLLKQFVKRVVRGTILRFEFDNWGNAAKTDPGPKFGVVLNRPDVSDPIYLALTTSKVEKYAAFGAVVVTVEIGEYDCFDRRTLIPFRSDPQAVPRQKLEEQIVAGKLTFVGDLTPAHLASVDKIIREGVYVSANLIPLITPAE
jgi:hypothetical protein